MKISYFALPIFSSFLSKHLYNKNNAMSIFDNMEAITEVNYYVEATPGMVASLVINQTNGWDSLKQMTCPVTLTVLKVEKTNGNFAGRCGIALYKFVLMDANRCILKAQLNTGQSAWMKDQDVTVGASIFVNRYHYVWHDESTLDEGIMDGELGRGVMVIDKFTWKDGPKKAWDAADRGVEDATTIVSDDFAVEFVADTVIAHCYNQSCMMYLSEHWQTGDDAGCMFLGTMLFNEVQLGKFIPAVNARADWLAVVKKKKTESLLDDSSLGHHASTLCSCQQQYHLSRCVLESFPLCNVDVDELFAAAKIRVNTTGADGNTFHELHPRHQRWCFYWWYAINIFRQSTAVKLPKNCFIRAVRELYPNPEGEHYTGYKTSDQRATERHERALAAMTCSNKRPKK